MRNVCFVTCFALIFVVAVENVNAQDYTAFYKRLASLRRPVIISRNGSRIFYESSGHVESNAPEPYKNDDANKVRIDVYYETDCPDSMRFITKQLYPLYKEMGEIVDIHLYPYGKAYRYFDDDKNDYSFSCHHGPSECHGNTVQTCALSLYPNLEDALNLINCMESYPRPSRSGQKCARRLSLDWEKIDKCATGELGYKLLNKMANETESLNPQLYFVPWIVFDKVFNQADFRIAQRNLKGVVCNKYKGHHVKC